MNYSNHSNFWQFIRIPSFITCRKTSCLIVNRMSTAFEFFLVLLKLNVTKRFVNLIVHLVFILYINYMYITEWNTNFLYASLHFMFCSSRFRLFLFHRGYPNHRQYTFYENTMSKITEPRKSFRLTKNYIRYTVVQPKALQIDVHLKRCKIGNIFVQLAIKFI